MSITLRVHHTDVATVVAVAGRLTLGEGASRLRETLQQLVADGTRRIVLNLAELSYLDSSGIGLLVSSYATMNRVGGQIKLASLSSRVKDLLLITKLLTVFEIYEHELAALDSFADSGKAAKGNA
jgi:anti-sigma B factor antagonist